MNFEDMLLKAMSDGKSLEDIMKDISTAATKIEKDRAAAHKYDKYNKPAYESYDSLEAAQKALLCANKLGLHDVAILITHFMCQNVPGYSKVLAKDNIDPIDTYQKILEDQMGIAKVLTKHKNDSITKRSEALFNHILDEIFDPLLDKITKSKDKDVKPTAATSDADKLAKFLKDMNLL